MDSRYMFDTDGNQNLPHREWMLDFKQAIGEVRAVLNEQGRGEEFIGAKVGERTSYHTRHVVTHMSTDHIHHRP